MPFICLFWWKDLFRISIFLYQILYIRSKCKIVRFHLHYNHLQQVSVMYCPQLKPIRYKTIHSMAEKINKMYKELMIIY
jgi:hypothetical protein